MRAASERDMNAKQVDTLRSKLSEANYKISRLNAVAEASSGSVDDQVPPDDDQDAVWLRVKIPGSGASCHVGYRSCFYRSVALGEPSGGPAQLTFREADKAFDPNALYGDAPNPTKL